MPVIQISDDGNNAGTDDNIRPILHRRKKREMHVSIPTESITDSYEILEDSTRKTADERLTPTDSCNKRFVRTRS